LFFNRDDAAKRMREIDVILADCFFEEGVTKLVKSKDRCLF